MSSDKDIQEFWARALAGKVNNPTSYSKKTIEILFSLDKQDIDLFKKFSICSFIINGNYVPIVDSRERFLEGMGINADLLTHLDEMGLINFNRVQCFMETNLPMETLVIYYKNKVTLQFKKDKNVINTGKVNFTSV